MNKYIKANSTINVKIMTNKTCCINNSSSFLPKIKLPIFKGDYENWLPFKIDYLSIVYNNESINIANKYNFIRTSLEGCAKKVIEGFDFFEEQYEVAWKTLCERFDKERIPTNNNNIEAIFKTESIKRDSASSHRKLIDERIQN